MTRRSAPRLAAVALVSGALTVSCGGGGTEYLSQDEFCSKAADLQGTEADLSPETVKVVIDLAKRAPTKELRDAFQVILPAWQKISTIDSNDTEKLMSVISEFDTQEMNDAGQVLDDYVTGVCGSTDESSSSDDGDSDGDTSADDGDSDSTDSSTDPYDQIDFTELIDTIDSLLPLYGDVTATTGTSMSGLYPGAEIIIPFDVEGDGVALCNGVLDWVATQTDDPNVVIRVQAKGTDTVTRMAGGDCMGV